MIRAWLKDNAHVAVWINAVIWPTALLLTAVALANR